MTNFKTKVLRIVSQIPRGHTRTYKQVAQAAGHPGAARAVGMIMKNNFNPKVPCHRVIRSDGGVGDYNRGGIKAKRRKLQAEGAVLSA